jgi:hypothetical protein
MSPRATETRRFAWRDLVVVAVALVIGALAGVALVVWLIFTALIVSSS